MVIPLPIRLLHCLPCRVSQMGCARIHTWDVFRWIFHSIQVISVCGRVKYDRVASYECCMKYSKHIIL
jgi:hypothetical protein